MKGRTERKRNKEKGSRRKREWRGVGRGIKGAQVFRKRLRGEKKVTYKPIIREALDLYLK